MRSPETEIARRSLAQFGVCGVLRRIANGLDISYRVRTAGGQVFALRVAKDIEIRRASAFRVEAEWIDALADNRWIGVPQVQRTVDGEVIGEVQGHNGTARASTLLSWMPGRRRFEINEGQARVLGQATGALHQHAQALELPSDGAIKAWNARLMCLMGRKDGLHHFGVEVVELVHRVYDELLRVVAKLDSQDMGLINADVGLHNLLWHKGQVGLVDFNDAGIGPYAFCLGRLVERIRLHDHGDDLVNELLSGYCEVTPLPTAYEKWGRLFEMAAAVFKLNFSTARISERGTALQEREQYILRFVKKGLKSLNV